MKHIPMLLAGCLATAGLLALPQAFAQDADAVAEKATKAPLRAELNQLAPGFELTDTAGKTWNLKNLKGQTVILEWYNPECPMVRRAHSEGGALQGLGTRVQQNPKVTWLAINSGAPGMEGAGKDKNVASRTKFGIEYPVLLDESGATGRAYRATTTPHMYIINPDGVLVYMGGHHTDKEGDLITPAIQAAMKGEKPSPQRTANRGCSVKYPSMATLGAVAPYFDLTDLNGQKHQLENTVGKIVVLEWFNPQCPVVVAAHENGGPLETLSNDLTRSGQVMWMAVNSGAEDHATTAKAANTEAAKKWGLKHPILMDPTGKVGKTFAARVTPQMVVIDQKGVIVYQGNPGTDETPYVKSIVTRLLKGETVAPTQTEASGCSVKYAKGADSGEGNKKKRRKRESVPN